MRGQGYLAPLLVVAGGCSLIYDPDQLGPPADASRPVDAADGGTGRAIVVAQTEVVEGLGLASDDSTRPCTTLGCDGRHPPLVILTTDADHVGGLVVGSASIRGVPEVAPLVDVLLFDAATGWTVLAVRIPVSAGLGEQGYVLELSVTVAGVTEVVLVPVQGLAELVLTSGSAPLRPRYSKVTVPPGTVTRLDTAAVRLVATSDLVIDGHLTLDAAEDRPGPGGCRGGVAGLDAGCAAGGGRSTDEKAGAGGGGFAGNGEGNGAGVATGRPSLVPLGFDGNVGNGGGAHGTAIGGHGAGVVELTAAGTIRFGALGRVTAIGGTPPVVLDRFPGGGSGGAILLRAGLALNFNELPRTIDATGGGPAGFRGADGRIRIDTPALPPIVPSLPSPGFEGAAWLAVPLVARTPVPVTYRRARVMRNFAATAMTVDGVMVSTCPIMGIDDNCSRALDATPGLHTVCLHQDVGQPLTAAENATCVSFVSLPAGP